jgi:DNA invertase Pin-like site-specific DNA recombinase
VLRWTVADDYVFVDDGVSGAEFANRPGFVRLMNVLKPRAPFALLIMSEVSRLGREQIETAYALKQLSMAGVRCFSYLEDREQLMESATDKFLLGAVTFAADLEREKARQRTYDAMLRKAKAGHVTGGVCFGYRNVEIIGADGRRSHVERGIEPVEADVIRRIFQLSADGYGMKAIAKQLNADRAPSPRPQQGRSQSWAPSSVGKSCFVSSIGAKLSGVRRGSATVGATSIKKHVRKAIGFVCPRRRCGSSVTICGTERMRDWMRLATST